MKFKVLAIIAIAFMTSCQDKTKSETVEEVDYSEENLNATTSIYPETITKVFDAHGGLDKWNEMGALKFTMPKETGDEVTTTNLQNRESLIDMPHHSVGYDGEMVWLQKKDTTSYQGNAKFYYNLMFYFYAMPFVLADDGINYEEVEALNFEGKDYPGIKVSYESGVGESPEDEYILYYNPETFQMEWLGYTVTYFSKEKSEKWSFIKYAEWQNVNGLQLPKTMTWYKVEDNLPTEPRNDVAFTNVQLMKESMPATTFEKPEEAEAVE